MLKKIISILLGTVFVVTAASCSRPQSGSADAGKIKVSVSFDVLKEFVTAVGGDAVAVSVIIPDGTEPHDFEPKAQDLAILREADIFIVNGLGMEPWAENAVEASQNTGVIIVDASSGVETIALTEEEHAEESDAANDDHGAYDPHIWLSPKCAVIMTKNITDALIKADPDNGTLYLNNYTAYAAELESFYNEYSDKFKAVENKSFVTGHAAFAYLCRDFGLQQNSVEDVFAEGEPSAQQLSSLVDYCKANHVTTIFSEAFENRDVADTLAREAGAEVKSIYTLESVENGKSYLERMEENLKVIYESLK